MAIDESPVALGGGAPMPLAAHLRELRVRLLVSILALVPGTVLGFVFYEQISRFIGAPICGVRVNAAIGNGQCGPLAITGSLLAPFNLQVKIALATGVLFSAPIWIYQLWAFVTPGLYRNERRWSIGFLASAIPLFFAGATVSYLILPKATEVLLGFAPENVEVLVQYDQYLSLVLRLSLVFGLAFLAPVFIIMLNAAGVLPARTLGAHWRPVVLGVFLFAAVATPTGDPVTLLALAIPMLLLIGGAHMVTILNDRRRARRATEPDYASLADDEVSPL